MELFSPGHLIVLAIVVAVLFFGWKQLPDMSRALGRSLRIFKTEIKGLSDDEKARDQAKEQPRAIDPPRAEMVKNDTPSESTTRPRPAPSPNGQSRTPTPGA